MSDKRTVATDALDTLGTAPLDDTAKRDAIHLAVEPVTAGERMNAGDHITVRDGIAWRADDGDEDAPLGIVDPFLRRPVKKGERFWFVMYPRTIKSLRHVWAHPAFPDEAGTPALEPAEIPATKRIESEEWLRNFCDTANCPSYERLMATVEEGKFDDSLHCDGEASGDIPPEFWTHAEIVLGRKIENHPTYFSCSC